MLLTGKEPAQQLYAQIDQRISAAATVPGLFALYDPEDVPAGWYLRSIQRAGEAHGIPVIAAINRYKIMESSAPTETMTMNFQPMYEGNNDIRELFTDLAD